MKKYLTLNADIMLGLMGILFGVSFLVYSYWESASAFYIEGDVPPFLVPQLFLYILICLSVVLCTMGFVKNIPSLEYIHGGKVLLSIAVVAIAIGMMASVGYLICAPLCFVAIAYILNYQNKKAIILSAIGVSFSLYILLVKVAKMPLPIIPWLGV